MLVSGLPGDADSTAHDGASAERGAFFARRLRTAFWVIVAAVGVMTVSDLHRPPDQMPSIMATKVVMIGALAVLMLSLRVERVRRHPVLVGLVGVALTCGGATWNGVLKGDATTTVVVLAIIALSAIAVLPWGLAPQIVTALIAGLGMAITVIAVNVHEHASAGVLVQDGLASINPLRWSYAGATAFIALAVLVYVAREFSGYRRAIERTNRELREAERFARATVDALPVDIAILDASGRIVGVNRAWQERATSPGMVAGGIEPGVDLVARCERLASEGSAAARDLAIGIRAMLSRRQDAFALEVSSGSGAEQRWFAVGVTPFHSRGPLRLVLTQEEITVQRRAAIALREAKEAAELASRAKGDFLANMSHEIRTPMHGIIGMTDIVLDSPLDDDQRQHLSSARAAAGALLTVLNDVLDFSQIEAGKLQLVREPFELEPRLRGTFDTFVPRARLKGVELRCELSSALPPVVVGDAFRLTQILVNLLGNAIKFTERGSITLAVESESAACGARGAALGLPADGCVVVVRVADTGIGIAADKLQLIFERFQQADGSSTRLYGGSGLGLSIVKHLCELMEGEVSVESAVGVGSTFRARLPFGLPDGDGAAGSGVIDASR